MKPCCNDSCEPKEIVPLKSFRALVKEVKDHQPFLVPQDGTEGQVLTWIDGEDQWGTFTVSWNQVTGKPTTFPPSAHTHSISEVTGLQAALDDKADLVHGHSQSDISGLIAALAGKAPLVHTHPISQVSGLQAQLDALEIGKTITPGGTTGARTINERSGTVNFAPAATTLVVTNSLVTADSLVFLVLRTADATAVLDSAVPTAGSFTIRMSVAPTSETSVGFVIF